MTLGSATQAAMSLRKKHDTNGSLSVPADREDGPTQETATGTRTRTRTRGSISARLSPLSIQTMDVDAKLPAGPSPLSRTMTPTSTTCTATDSPALTTAVPPAAPSSVPNGKKATGLVYEPRERKIERLTMRQLGEATPDVMHPFFMKKAGFNLEDSLPQYVHEYATLPTEEIMKALLKLYSKQLTSLRSAVDTP